MLADPFASSSLSSGNEDLALLSELVRLLGEGREVTLTATGDSMRPFIRGGRDKVLLVPATPKLAEDTLVPGPAGKRKASLPGLPFRKGDIVLAQLSDTRFVLHRIDNVPKTKGDPLLVLMGDGNLRVRELCRPADVKAVVSGIIKADGRMVAPNSPTERLKARVWRLLLPLRRILLKLQ